jgi:nucleoside-diphosphate-sugar epimerase
MKMEEFKMKILLLGAAGVIGRRLIPLLVASDHTVIGTTRVPEKAQILQQLGASPLLVDVFEREKLFTLVRETRPDIIIHQLTDLSERNFSANTRIRQVGTRNLVDAANAAGVQRLIAQSIAWAYAPGEGPADESVPLDIDATAPRINTIKGVQALESAVSEVSWSVILRYGILYGPGTWYARAGSVAEQVRRGELVANEGVTSFLHVDDAARATLLALQGPQGIFNVVDDEPAPATAWLPVYAKALDAPTPATSTAQPRGERGATNHKARTLLHWQPAYASWREGFSRSLEA